MRCADGSHSTAFCQEQKVSFLSTDTECHCAWILVRNLPFLFFPAGFRSPWHGDIGQHHCNSHADNGLHLSALWQEVALLHPRMSIRFPAADSRQRDEIQDKNESLGNQAAWQAAQTDMGTADGMYLGRSMERMDWLWAFLGIHLPFCLMDCHCDSPSVHRIILCDYTPLLPFRMSNGDIDKTQILTYFY